MPVIPTIATTIRRPTGSSRLPTLRVNPGDVLNLKVVDRIQEHRVDEDEHGSSVRPASCGDTGTATLNSTNVHFHGMNVPPVCHQDDVINTLIQPGTPGFQYNVHVPDVPAAGSLLVPSAHSRLHRISSQRRRGRSTGCRGNGKGPSRSRGTYRARFRDSPAVPRSLDSRSLPALHSTTKSRHFSGPSQSFK